MARVLVLLALLGATAVHARPPEAVTILRDAYGVPHIFTEEHGDGERGAYANGYAQAEDRLFEMDILRRVGTGRLAEMLGPDYLLMDEVVRRDGYKETERDRFFRRLSGRDRRALLAYRDGVNAFIRKVTLDPRLLPFEFTGTPPAPWKVGDSVAVAILELLVEGANGGMEVLNADLLLDLFARYPEREAMGIFDDLVWIDEPAAPTTIAAGEGHGRTHERTLRFAPRQLALVRDLAPSIRRAAAVLRREQGLMGGLGGHRHMSNAILLSPALSATGHPILLGGPQTGLNAPSFFWEIGLHGGGFEGEGVIAPAGPGVLIGRGRDFAMTLTSGIDDAVDTFVDNLDSRHPDRYRFRGQAVPLERRRQRIKVSGQPDVERTFLRTLHGPVFYLDEAAGVAYSRRAAFRGLELDSAAAVASIGRVRNLRDFRRLADRMALSFNLHYADDAGNIGYFHRGVRQRRPPHTDPRLPYVGNGSMEWRGITAARHGPTVVNPRRGYITNWNNKPIPGWPAGEQRELWGVVDRVQVFIDALEAAKATGQRLGVLDVKRLMRRAAESDIFAHNVLPFVESAVAGQPDAALHEAVGRLRAWVDAGASLAADPTGVVPDPGAAIYTELRTAAQLAVLGPVLGDAVRAMFYPAVLAGDMEDDHGSFGSPDALFLRVLFSAGAVPGAPLPAGLLPVSRDYFAPRTRAAVLADALGTALGRLATRFGTADQSRWQLPALTETYRDIGILSAIFGPTVQARENRGSFNLVVDLGPPVRGEIVVAPGESGTFTNADVGHEPPHLRDQLRLYEAFEYRRQPFTPDELEGPITAETIPVVR